MLDIQSLNCLVNNKTILSINNLEVLSGDFNAVIGVNGAGKSTLIKAIAGEIPTSGNIFFHGQNIVDWSNLERAKHLAVLPQSSQLSFPFTAKEVVGLGLTPLSLTSKEAREHINAKMKKTDCYHLKDKLYPQLSGGEKQRVHLARILLQLCQASKPPLLLLDEPTSAQDLGQQHAILSLIQALCKEQGYACLAILHDLNLVLQYCQKCVLLDKGNVVDYESPIECLNEDNIKQYWGYQAEIVKTSSKRKSIII